MSNLIRFYIHLGMGALPSSLQIITNLKCRSGNLAHASRMFSTEAAITIKQNKQKTEMGTYMQ